ncbi:hypothetical protein LTS18_006867, partial [Coniosporium uncinatum]
LVYQDFILQLALEGGDIGQAAYFLRDGTDPIPQLSTHIPANSRGGSDEAGGLAPGAVDDSNSVLTRHMNRSSGHRAIGTSG